MTRKIKSQEIWGGLGIEIYREGRMSTQSISFEKKRIPKAISAILLISRQAAGSGAIVGGTEIRRTRTTIRMTDYQGRKLSIGIREIPIVIAELRNQQEKGE